LQPRRIRQFAGDRVEQVAWVISKDDTEDSI
jgi:hypothetical protein